MNTTAMIMSIVSILGCLILVMRNSQIRNMDGRRAISLALIWGAILIVLVLVIQWSGLRIAP